MRENVIEELKILDKFQNNPSKDIIIIVKDCLDYTKQCIESILQSTSNFKLYVWDNNSSEDTKSFLKSIPDINLVSSDKNLGFVIPNNKMIKKGNSDYVILLNNDTIVSPNWDRMLMAILKNNPTIGATGYCGGKINKNGIGSGCYSGYNVDYIAGWCLAINRNTYNKFGLFDQKIDFAYGEDSDFCLRLKSNGLKIYALYTQLVQHYGHKTTETLTDEEFKQNINRIKKNGRTVINKWKNLINLQY